MPHDRKNKELKPGDKVVLIGTVEEVYPGSAVCNVIVQPEHALADPAVFGKDGAAWRNDPMNWKGPVTLCAHWLEKRPA